MRGLWDLTVSEWVTMIGSIVAAVAGSWNLWRSFFDSADKIDVRYGGFRPHATPAIEMYVINMGNHPVQLSDYGFVNKDGRLFSIPWYYETEAFMDGADPHEYRVGTTEIAPHEIFALGMSYRNETIGAYAFTVKQRLPRVDMYKSRLRPFTFILWLRAKFFRHYS